MSWKSFIASIYDRYMGAFVTSQSSKDEEKEKEKFSQEAITTTSKVAVESDFKPPLGENRTSSITVSSISTNSQDASTSGERDLTKISTSFLEEINKPALCPSSPLWKYLKEEKKPFLRPVMVPSISTCVKESLKKANEPSASSSSEGGVRFYKNPNDAFEIVIKKDKVQKPQERTALMQMLLGTLASPKPGYTTDDSYQKNKEDAKSVNQQDRDN